MDPEYRDGYVLVGDCVERLKGLPDCSVDSVVTDPPYGLEFMGKQWDSFKTGRSEKYASGGGLNTFRSVTPEGGTNRDIGPTYTKRPAKRCSLCGKQAWSGSPCVCETPQWTIDNSPSLTFQAWFTEVAAELYRVLKPGGHLLAFGGTRMYHRMVCAIEDAGFEIRDSIHWTYGSGFPKSLNVGKAIDKQKSNRDEVLTFTAWVRSARDAAGITNTDIDEAFGFAGMAGHWTSSKSQPSVPTLEQMPRLLDVLGVDEMPTDIQALALRLNDAKGQPGPNWFRREVVGEDTKARSADSGSALPTLGAETVYKTWNLTAPATDAAQQWEGWGTALKPSHEPIVVARKPLSGTVAQTVQQWGTGALNIDGCRVGSEMRYNAACGVVDGSPSIGGGLPPSADGTTCTGRWPANTVITHHADCVQVGQHTEHHPETVNTNGPLGIMNDDGWQPKPITRPATTTTTTTFVCAPGCPVPVLDAQSGQSTGRVGMKPKPESKPRRHDTGIQQTGQTFDPGTADKGGASRYFTQTTWDPQWDAPFIYQPKPSRRERNAGLDALPEHDAPGIDAGRENGSLGQKTAPRTNMHPTVKPVALMRHLIRLVTPPGGIILDPFLGSGTTAVAAILEGAHWIGCEMTAEYLPIIDGRVLHAEKEAEPPTQPPLF